MTNDKDDTKIVNIDAYIDDIGECAYNGYCETSNYKSLISGDELPTWDELPEKIKNAWINSALKVLSLIVK